MQSIKAPNHPIIVIEGPDGSGKTTLANQLCKELGAKYVHLTYRWGSKMFDYHTAALFYVLRQAEHQPVVLDRWWPSEIIYADVFRGGSKWPLAYRLFEKAALLYGFTFINCLPQDKVEYLKHFDELQKKRLEMFNNMEKIYDKYYDLFNGPIFKGRQNVLSYDFMSSARYGRGWIPSMLDQVEYNFNDSFNLVNPRLYECHR
jgi:thymidylate kinase